MISRPHHTRRVPFLFKGISKTVAVHEWGEASNQNILICVHGLSRNGRDFDVFAAALCDQYRVLCPDVPGRGESDWFDDAIDYSVPNYVSCLAQVLRALEVHRFDWVGTSMGGLIGMGMAALPASGLRRFVINDVGPHIERTALERISLYMKAKAPVFSSFDELYLAAQPALAPFGPLTEAQKVHLVRTSACKDTYGASDQWRFNSDPKIAEAFVNTVAAPAADLWPLWALIQQPTLVLRGAYSDLLSEATVAQMLVTRRNVQSHTVAETGHAPMLMDHATIEHVRRFLVAST